MLESGQEREDLVIYGKGFIDKISEKMEQQLTLQRCADGAMHRKGQLYAFVINLEYQHYYLN